MKVFGLQLRKRQAAARDSVTCIKRVICIILMTPRPFEYAGSTSDTCPETQYDELPEVSNASKVG